MRLDAFIAALVIGAAASDTVAFAQFQITASDSLEVTPVKNAPFAAQAVTEFTQILGDGNRIERRYESSVARDSRGRIRREEQIALVGALAAAGAPPPHLVTITDGATTYTIDNEQRIVYRSLPAAKAKHAAAMLMEAEVELLKRKLADVKAAPGAVRQQKTVEVSATQVTELGTRTIEGIRAEGRRTTQTIPAGAIGNVLPIEIVSERWFSTELQMPILITRRDPQSGETIYRLTNIVRGEQPDSLFTVPPGYDISDNTAKFLLLDAAKTKKLERFTKEKK